MPLSRLVSLCGAFYAAYTPRLPRHAHAELLHKGSRLLLGKNKWLGGVEGLDGKIYCLPAGRPCAPVVCARHPLQQEQRLKHLRWWQRPGDLRRPQPGPLQAAQLTS